MNIVLYLMNVKGKRTLEKLCEHFGAQIITAVICSRDPKVENDYYDEIKIICDDNDIIFLDRDEDTGTYNNFYRFAIGWRWIIPVKEKLIIFHDSLLPKYRGFAPLVNSLINNEPRIGVTALFASDQFDRGDIIAQKSIQINYPVTIAEAISMIVPLYQELAIKIVQLFESKKLKGIRQNETEATYSIWRDEEDYHINWNDSAIDIVQFINSVGPPYSGAYSFMGAAKVRIFEATVFEDIKLELRHVGKIMLVDGGSPVIITGKGLVKLNKLTDVEGSNLLPLKYFRVRFK